MKINGAFRPVSASLAALASRDNYVYLYIFYDEKYIVKISNRVILYITPNFTTKH